MPEVRTADRGDVRDINLRAVLEVLRAVGATTRAQIARETGLSAPTVSAVVAALTEAGIVASAGVGPSTGGRRGDLIEFRPDARLVFALDLSADPPCAALVDLSGSIVDGSRVTVPASGLSGPDELVTWVQRRVREAAGVIGIGVAVPGVTDPVAGVIDWAPSLGWRHVPLRAALETAVPEVIVAIDNDLNLATLGEYAYAPEKAQDLVMIGLRGGLGAGVMLGGSLHRGVHFAAGEIGYLPVHSSVRGSRDFGELETTVLARLGKHGSGRPASARQAETTSDGTAVLGAGEGEVVDLLAFACVAIAAVLDVAAIVLSDEVVQQRADLPGEIARRLAESLPHPPQVIASQLGAEGTLQGAAVAVQQRLTLKIRRLLT
jgi:predicted NBD/HSP70 family sugar kinase